VFGHEPEMPLASLQKRRLFPSGGLPGDVSTECIAQLRAVQAAKAFERMMGLRVPFLLWKRRFAKI